MMYINFWSSASDFIVETEKFDFFVDYSLFWCHDQFFYSRANVHLLWAVGARTSHAEVPLVEEIFDTCPAGKFHEECTCKHQHTL